MRAGVTDQACRWLCAGGSIVVGSKVVAAEVEEVVDPIVGRKEALRLAC